MGGGVERLRSLVVGVGGDAEEERREKGGKWGLRTGGEWGTMGSKIGGWKREGTDGMLTRSGDVGEELISGGVKRR